MKRKNKIWTLEDLEKLEELCNNPDYSTNDIAKYFGKSVNNINATINYYHIKKIRYEDTGYRKCCICNLVLPLNEYHYNCQDKKHHKTFICKHCSSERCKKYYYKKKKESVTNE